MRTCLLLVFLFFVSSAYSQHAVVAANKMNVLYIGIDNPISVAADNYSCKDLVVEISHGTVTINDYNYNDRHNEYLVKVFKPGKATITVKNKKGKLLGQVDFRIKRVPDPVAKIGDMNGGLISKYKLRVQRGVIAVLENYDIDIKFNIVSFDVISYNLKSSRFFYERNKGPVFNYSITGMLQNIDVGDGLMIENIIAVGPDGYRRDLAPIFFKVIDSDKSLERKKNMQLCCDFAVDTNYLTEKQKIWMDICNCTNIDYAVGETKSNKRVYWWDYYTIDLEDTIIARREYYNTDTVKQIFYKEGIKDKEQTYIYGELAGDYLEYHINGKIKLKGYYTVDSVSTDTINIIDPITMDEWSEVTTNYRSSKSGTWQYYNEQGILTSEEKYAKGQLVK